MNLLHSFYDLISFLYFERFPYSSFINDAKHLAKPFLIAIESKITNLVMIWSKTSFSYAKVFSNSSPIDKKDIFYSSLMKILVGFLFNLFLKYQNELSNRSNVVNFVNSTKNI